MFHQITKLLSIGFLCAGMTAGGETLDSVTAEAQRNNPELREWMAAVGSARGGVRTARVLANPELSVAPGLRRASEPGGAGHEFHGTLELSQLLEFPGKRALKIALAQKNALLQEVALEGFRAALTAKVRAAFYELLAATRMEAVRGDQVESARTFVTSTRHRAASGYTSDFETIKSEAELIAAERERLAAQEKVIAARLTLNRLLGRRPDLSLSLTGSLEEATGPEHRESGLMALALARHPSLRAKSLEAEAAGLSLRSSRFGRRPDFAVGPQIEYSKDEQIYGVGVTVALPFWDRKQGEIQTATAEQERALAELERTRLEIAAAVTQASDAVALARAQLALYRPAFLDRLKRLVAQAEEGYAQNATSLLLYLDAKQTYFDTLAGYYEALGHAAQARAALETAVGVPLELPAATPQS